MIGFYEKPYTYVVKTFSLGLHIILNVSKYVVDLLIRVPSHMQYWYQLYNDILMLPTDVTVDIFKCFIVYFSMPYTMYYTITCIMLLCQ